MFPYAFGFWRGGEVMSEDAHSVTTDTTSEFRGCVSVSVCVCVSLCVSYTLLSEVWRWEMRLRWFD